MRNLPALPAVSHDYSTLETGNIHKQNKLFLKTVQKDQNEGDFNAVIYQVFPDHFARAGE